MPNQVPWQANLYTTLAAQRLSYSNEMQKKQIQMLTQSDSAATATTLASTAVRKVLTIPKSLFTIIKIILQTNLFDTDLGGFAEVAWGIINEILRCKNM